MDISPFIAPLVTALITAGGVYAAITSRLTRLETEIRNLRVEVEKHNQIVERTYKLEANVDNLYHRYGELRDDIKIGGTE